MRPITTSLLHSICVIATATACLYAQSSTPSPLKTEIETFFSELKTTFDKSAASPSVKGTNLSKTERYFVSVLKGNQPFYSLMKTNSKGVMITEVIRGQSPEREFRNIKNQRWFYTISKSLSDYNTYIKDKNGRYYLLWAKPILKNNNRFVGAIVVKVDLWDSFYKISSDRERPFLIKLSKRSLFSHKWKNAVPYDQEPLEIPGAKNIQVRYPKGAFDTTPESASTLAAATDSIVTPPQQPALTMENRKDIKPVKNKLTTFHKTLLIIMVIALLGLIIYLTKLMTIFSDWRLKKKIDREDNLFQ
jgi:hypothetical protein